MSCSRSSLEEKKNTFKNDPHHKYLNFDVYVRPRIKNSRKKYNTVFNSNIVINNKKAVMYHAIYREIKLIKN